MSATLLQPRIVFTRALIVGLVGGVIAAVINVIIYFAAQGVNGGPLIVQTQPLSLVAVLLFSVAPGLVAGVIYWVLARLTRAPARWFLILSGLVFVLFLFGPLGAASGTVTIWALELMHVGTAVPIVGAILKWLN